MIAASTMWAIFYAYCAALGALTIIVTAKGGEPMRRTIWALVAVCVLGFLFQYYVSTRWYYSAFMVLVNAAACWLITRHPASRWQALIGWSFLIQIGSDVGRIAVEMKGGVIDNNLLYWETTGLAYIQLLFVVGWGIADGLFRYSGRRRDYSSAYSSDHSGVG